MSSVPGRKWHEVNTREGQNLAAIAYGLPFVRLRHKMTHWRNSFGGRGQSILTVPVECPR